MINFLAIDNATVHPYPFPYATFNNLLTHHDVESLINALPYGADQRTLRQQGSDKTYRNTTSVLLELGAPHYNPKNKLTSSWINFLDLISSRDYRIYCSKLFGAELINCHPEITIRKYQHEDYISAHTDRDCVYATQLIFLNTQWNETWGGLLHFMTDAQNDYCQFIPHFSSSILFLRTDSSWHRVSKVVQPGVERIALQIAFWKKVEKVTYEGRKIRDLHPSNGNDANAD